LGAADAKRRDQHRAAIAQRVLDHRPQACAAGVAVFVAPIAIGALQHQHISAFRWPRRGQQRGVGGAEIAREDDALRGLLWSHDA